MAAAPMPDDQIVELKITIRKRGKTCFSVISEASDGQQTVRYAEKDDERSILSSCLWLTNQFVRTK